MRALLQQPLALLGTLALTAPLVSGQTFQDRFLRIMPLGDSNTAGTFVVQWPGSMTLAHDGGYRSRLYQLLESQPGAYSRPNFVGNRFGLYDPVSLIDNRHEGYGGATISQIADFEKVGASGSTIIPIEERLAVWDPAVVLLSAGTNDLAHPLVGEPVADAPLRLDALITRIVAYNPDIRVVVGSLIPTTFAVPGDATDVFNAALPAIVANHQALGHHVSLVDLNAAVPTPLPPGDLSGLHPTQQGYDQMASAWFLGIQALGPLQNPNPARHHGLVQLGEVTAAAPAGPAPWQAQTTDLIDSHSATFASAVTTGYEGTPAMGHVVLNDGLLSASARDDGPVTPNTWTTTYQLNLTPGTGGSAKGYDLTGIRTTSFDNPGTFYQAYRIEVEVIGQGWQDLGTFHHIPVATPQTGAELTLRSPTGAPIATRVSAVRFHFLPPPTGGSASYAEVDVIGKPSR